MQTTGATGPPSPTTPAQWWIWRDWRRRDGRPRGGPPRALPAAEQLRDSHPGRSRRGALRHYGRLPGLLRPCRTASPAPGRFHVEQPSPAGRSRPLLFPLGLSRPLQGRQGVHALRLPATVAPAQEGQGSRPSSSSGSIPHGTPLRSSGRPAGPPPAGQTAARLRTAPPSASGVAAAPHLGGPATPEAARGAALPSGSVAPFWRRWCAGVVGEGGPSAWADGPLILIKTGSDFIRPHGVQFKPL
jgi:hypothetical protein